MKTNENMSIEQAAELLKEGYPIAFVTETVYGLGADATNEQAVAKIFEAKGRPSDNPLIVHIASVDQVDALVKEIPVKAKSLMDVFWPGPLTIIFPKSDLVASNVTAGLDSVGIRMPSHPIAKALLEKVNLPIAAPSANTSGKPSPTTAYHVYDDLNGKILGIVDGGPVDKGIESTVIDCTLEPPVILRPGSITKEMIEEVIGPVLVSSTLEDNTPKAPGMKYRHYAPKANLILIDGDESKFIEVVSKDLEDNKKVGILVPTTYHQVQASVKLAYREDVEFFARNLYLFLREFDRYDLDVIYVKYINGDGLAKSIMNRLLKASNDQVIK